VVPTWNYVAVHAYGTMRLFEQPEALLRNVKALTNQNEANFAGPWGVEDAPEEYIAGQLKAIVGIEIPIERLEGKWKVSQNRANADREGAIAGLEQLGTAESTAMAGLISAALKQKKS
jgi:transcriptional regulator